MTAIRILHVDDEPDIREVVELSLGLNPDFEIRSCGSGAEAVAIAAEWSPFIILLDVMMPGMDGFEVCRKLKAAPATAGIPVIFMDLVMPIKDGFAAIREIRELQTPAARVPIVAVSASAFENTRVQSVAAGCEDFITKPVRLDQVIDVVGRLLALDWRRAETATEFTAPRPRPDFNALALPPTLARELYELALSGDVQKLSSRLKESRRGDQATIDAVDALASLANDYDTRGLRAALRPMAERAS